MMTSIMGPIRRSVFVAAMGVAAILPFAQAQAEFPDKPVKVIVPTQAGGGMDSVARILQRYFEANEDALGQRIVVVNMPGAGGTIGTRAIMEAEPDGYTVGFWHEGLITSRAMGIVDYDHSSFEVLGATGFGDLGFGVAASAPFKDFGDLIENARSNPDSVKVATNVGLPVHFVPLMVQDKADVQFRYVQVGGGAKRFPSVVAKHTDFAIFGALEFIKWADADLKAIVMFTEERLPSLPDVPTAREFGVDVIAKANRIWLAPKGTPSEVTDHLSAALRTAMADEDVQSQLSDLGITPDYVEPDAMLAELDDWRARALPLVEKARELQK